MSSGCESFELLLLQHQSQLGVYAKSKECQPGVDPYSRLKYQLFLETSIVQSGTRTHRMLSWFRSRTNGNEQFMLSEHRTLWLHSRWQGTRNLLGGTRNISTHRSNWIDNLGVAGSGSYSPTQQGIPTHRYGGPAALKVEIRQACFQWISQGGVHVTC